MERERCRCPNSAGARRFSGTFHFTDPGYVHACTAAASAQLCASSYLSCNVTCQLSPLTHGRLFTNHASRTVATRPAYMSSGTWRSRSAECYQPSRHRNTASRAQATVAVPRTIGWIGMVQTCCIRILPDTGVVWVLPKVYGQRPVGPPAGAIPRPCHRRRSRDDVRSPAPYPASAATHLTGRDSDGPEPRSIQSPQ